MQQLLTKCPNCQTLFKVNEKQLQTAKGAVRCGSCMTVFNAREHIPSSHELPDVTSVPTPSFAHTSKKQMTKPQAKNSDYSPQADLTSPSVEKPHWSKAMSTDVNEIYNYFASELDLTKNPKSTERPSTVQNDQWAKDLLAELEEEPDQDTDPIPAEKIEYLNPDDEGILKKTQKNHTIQPSNPHELPRLDDELSDSFLNLPDYDKRKTSHFQYTAPTGEQEIENESWAKKILEEENEKEAQSEAAKSPLKATSQLKIVPHIASVETEKQKPKNNNMLNEKWSKSILQELDNQSKHIASNIQEAIAKTPKMVANKVSDQEPTLKDLQLIPLSEQKAKQKIDQQASMQAESNAITPTPLITDLEIEAEFEPVHQTSQTHSTANKRYWIISSIAILTLCFQYAIYNFEHLSKNPTVRPWYRLVCEIAGCTLPVRKDISLLQATNFEVREHNSIKSALTIDIILLNDASYPQPFPDLELSFSNLDGKEVAKRKFHPEEYRTRKLKNLQLMPSKQPLHLTLEIIDPGKEALNYQLNLYES